MLEDNDIINVEKEQFETPKRYTVKNSDTTQDDQIVITQGTYEVLIDSDESDINGCNSTVTAVAGDSIVKNIKGLELSKKHDLFVVKSFSAAKKPQTDTKTQAWMYHNSLRN